jgi:hypothetical protein
MRCYEESQCTTHPASRTGPQWRKSRKPRRFRHASHSAIRAVIFSSAAEGIGTIQEVSAEDMQRYA